MKSFIEQARFYVNYHNGRINLYTHFVGVPLIVFSIMILLGFVHISVPNIFDITFASIATIALLIYYFMLNWRLTLILIPFFYLLFWLSTLVSIYGVTRFSLYIFIITFILGWIFQLVGHFFEGKRPALIDNFAQSLIAPLFLIAEIFFMAGLMQNLKNQIYGTELPLNLPPV